MSKSIESSVVDGWLYKQLDQLNVKHSIEQGSIDNRIDRALDSAKSKQGGNGKNRPDAQVLIDNGNVQIPVMIENKGIKNRLIKTTGHDVVKLKNKYNHYDYKKTIRKYAVNGACYYSSVILHHTSSFPVVLAVGVNGYRDSTRRVNYEVRAYVVNTEHPDIPIYLKDYPDLSFLSKSNQSLLLKNIKDVQMDPAELQKHKADIDEHLTKVLKRLNQHLSENIRVNYRIFVVAGSIMAALGLKDDDNNYIVSPLNPDSLKSSSEDGETDGEKVMRKVKAFLKAERLPEAKRKKIINSLQSTLLFSNLSIKDDKTNESPLKTAYDEIYHNLVPAYQMTGGNLDFTGKLFNVMTDWISVPDGGKNDVVLTPRYITNLMANITQVNMNSYVWDWALGSGGFLISAMNRMLADARKRISSPDKLKKKLNHIKDYQLLGIEKLPDIYVLAVLNMILMGDGSSNILNEDSLRQFNGNYSYDKDKGKPFPANVLLLNPPYSAEGHGMIFLRDALEKMHSGMAAILIERSAGNGKATKINQDILKNNTLLATIKMPEKIFKGAKTNIFLFRVGVKHDRHQQVKFIDFTNDGYKHSHRKKSHHNLVDIDHAHARYKELANVVKYGNIDDAKWLKKGKTYFTDTIDPTSGSDWNFDQHIKIDKQVTPKDCDKTVRNYLGWRISDLLEHGGAGNDKD